MQDPSRWKIVINGRVFLVYARDNLEAVLRFKDTFVDGLYSYGPKYLSREAVSAMSLTAVPEP